MNKKMKKLGLYTMALLSMGLVACNQDFDTEFVPQTNLPESLLKMSDVSVAVNAPATIDLSEYIAEDGTAIKEIPVGTVSVNQGAMPANTILKAQVEFSKSKDFNQTIALDANSLDGVSEISVDPTTLQDAYFNDITRNPATTTLYMRTVLYTVTDGTSLAIVGKPGENYFAEKDVTFTPLNKLHISPAYYIVGGPNDWAKSAADKMIKFDHSDKDVYDDPYFSVVFDAAASGDTWFAIGDDEACEAIAAGADGAWNKLLGIVGGDNEATEGRLDYRYNMGAENSFKVPAGAKKIRVTLDMMNYTFKVEPVDIAEAYYLVGGPGSWSSDKSLKFSHSAANVFDDPVFTYTFEGNGGTGDIWFAFGDADALDAIDSNDWMQLYGYVGELGESGSFERRNVLGAENTFHVDGTAKFYRFQVNMATKTYTLIPMDFEEFIYVPGNAQKYNTSAEGMPDYGWTPGLAPALRSANFDGKYEGFAYMDGEFKFTKARNWDNGEYNYDSFTSYDDILTGNVGSGGNINCTTAGYYKLIADIPGGSLKAIKLTWGLVGPATPGGWDAGAYTVMTYNMADDCWEITTDLVAGEFKFTTNGTWDINLGGTLDDLSEGGNNLSIAEDGKYTIKLYPSRAQSDKMYATITKK